MGGDYIICDIETTGLSKSRDRITEIAAIKISGGRIVSEFQTLVNPRVPIPRFITHLTGIDDAMVQEAPTIDSAISEFIDFAEGNVFVGHNAAFDFGFLSHNASLHDLKFSNRRICTRKLANRIVPHLRSKRLCALCDYYRIVNEQEHRAMADARATLCVFNNFLARLRKFGINETKEVIAFERMSKKAIFDKYGTPW